MTHTYFVQLAEGAAALLQEAGFRYSVRALFETAQEMARWNDSLEAADVAEFYQLYA